jgi:hypothetical protein
VIGLIGSPVRVYESGFRYCAPKQESRLET